MVILGKMQTFPKIMSTLFLEMLTDLHDIYALVISVKRFGSGSVYPLP